MTVHCNYNMKSSQEYLATIQPLEKDSSSDHLTVLNIHQLSLRYRDRLQTANANITETA